MDYTASRVPTGQTHAVVRSFMAHHQGMSLLSLACLLLDRPMQRRFNANPFLRSAELLLHERVPKETSVLYPHELEADAERTSNAPPESTLRVFTTRMSGPPEVHLLSNGRYHVMVTNSGGRLQPLERHDDDALAGRPDAGLLGELSSICAMWTAAQSGRPRISPPLKPSLVMKRSSARHGRNFARV
ncbi:MAG: hypothetical protein WDN00_10280 [Limisphaerales bacterium]